MISHMGIAYVCLQLVLYAKATMLNQRVCAGEEGQLPAFLQCLSSMKVLIYDIQVQLDEDTHMQHVRM